MCRYPAQEISYTKLLGQLQDRGNTDLVKYYIELYSGAFLVHPLEKYSAKSYLTRGSSPKILVSCPALYTMNEGPNALNDPEKRGRIFEAVVGVRLLQFPAIFITGGRSGKRLILYTAIRDSFMPWRSNPAVVNYPGF